MTRWPVVVAALVVVTGVVSGRGGAFAQPRDPAAGEALFIEGRRLMKAGDKVEACAKFAESQRLDPAVGTLANLADCEEQIGRTASAWQHWRQAADEMPAGDPRRATASARAVVLEKRLSRLIIKLGPGAPAATAVARDGLALGAAIFGVAVPTDPGAHRVAVSAPGYGERRYDVVLAAGEDRTLLVEPGPALSTSKVEPPPLTAAAGGSLAPGARRSLEAGLAGQGPGDQGLLAESSSPPAGWRRQLAYGLLGTGVVVGGAGGYFAWRAMRARAAARDRCAVTAGDDPPACWSIARGALDRDRRFSLLADVGFATAALAAGTGLYLLLRGRDGGHSEVQLAAGPLSGGGEVQLAGRF